MLLAFSRGAFDSTTWEKAPTGASKLVHFSFWGLMKPQTLVHGGPPQGGCELPLTCTPRPAPLLPLICLTHAARFIIQKHSSGHELPPLRALLDLPPASGIMVKLSSSLSSSCNTLAFYWSVIHGRKSTRDRGGTEDNFIK